MEESTSEKESQKVASCATLIPDETGNDSKANRSVRFLLVMCCAIPAVLLYPLAAWAAKDERWTQHDITQGYEIAVLLLFLPTAFLLEFLFGPFFRGRETK